MKLLCVNHTGTISGAERSLLDLLRGLPDWIEARLACPRDSPLATAARTTGIEVDHIPGNDGSLRLHPRETPRALARIGAAAACTAVHARHMRADLIHANSIRAGLVSVPAARLIGVASVVHVRDRLPRSTVADASLRLVASGAQTVVANSRYTAEGLRAVTTRGRLRVVYNPVDVGRFSSARLQRAARRSQLGIPPSAFALAVIGQITPWKGQLEAIRVLGLLRSRGVEAHLLIVGEPKFLSAATRYDNASYQAAIEDLISAEALVDRVQLLGERSDIPAIVAALDALLVPSWEEPFGRVVVEAMAAGLPVLATSMGGPAEIIRDGVDGLLLPPREPARWADAVACLASSARLRGQLGDAAAQRARDFASPKHVAAMCDVYEQALASLTG